MENRNAELKVLWALQEMTHQVKVPKEVYLRAKTAVDKMLETGKI
jgi:quinolinate synthase